MIEFVTHKREKESELKTSFAEAITSKLNETLNSGKKVLLLLSGGSVIETYNNIAQLLNSNVLKNLTLGMVDERLFVADNMSCGLTTLNTNINANQIILETKLIETVKENSGKFIRFDAQLPVTKAGKKYEQELSQAITDADVTIAIMGMGGDGHIAGLKPIFNKTNFDNKFMDTDDRIATFAAEDFPFRGTITGRCIRKDLDFIYLFSTGDSKQEVLMKLKHDKDSDYFEFPGKILQDVSDKVQIFTDQNINN